MLMFNNISESGIYTLVYTFQNQRHEVTYNILVVPTSPVLITPGAYRILNRVSGKMLTSRHSGYAPQFAEELEGDESLSQVWHLVSDPDNAAAFNLQNDADGLYLAATGRSSSIFPAYPFHFLQAMGTQWFEVYDSSSAPRFWSVNKSSLLTLTQSTGVTDFPFALLPYEGTTAIGSVRGNQSKRTTIYNLMGQRVSLNSRGVSIVNGKKVVK